MSKSSISKGSPVQGSNRPHISEAASHTPLDASQSEKITRISVWETERYRSEDYMQISWTKRKTQIPAAIQNLLERGEKKSHHTVSYHSKGNKITLVIRTVLSLQWVIYATILLCSTTVITGNNPEKVLDKWITSQRGVNFLHFTEWLSFS